MAQFKTGDKVIPTYIPEAPQIEFTVTEVLSENSYLNVPEGIRLQERPGCIYDARSFTKAL